MTEIDGYARIARSAALNDGRGVRAALAELDQPARSVVATLNRHHVAELAIRALADDGADVIADAMRQELEAQRPPPVEQRELVDAFAEAQHALACASIPVLILKGTVLARRLYPVSEQRPQYDIDLLVPRRAARAAKRVLGRIGYRSGKRDQHAATLVRGRIKLDVHWALRSAPAYTIDELAVWRDAVPVMVDHVEARTLSDPHLLTLLAVSIVEDTALGMAKLKQLCDLWLLARELDPTFDWERWFGERARERLEGVVANGCALALSVLAGDEDAPNLSASLARRADVLRLQDREHGLTLLSAPRGEPVNMPWFAGVYPGSILAYRIHSFLAGFPSSIRDVRPARYVLSRAG